MELAPLGETNRHDRQTDERNAPLEINTQAED